MRNFARADTESQRAECAMSRGMAVAAHDSHAGLRKPQFRPDDVYDALALIGERPRSSADRGAVPVRLAVDPVGSGAI